MWAPCNSTAQSRVASTNKKLHSFAVGVGHRNVMQGWFGQIIIGVIVTVIGTLVADAISGGHMTRHFSHGYHASARWN
jgi:hypothetical protein